MKVRRLKNDELCHYGTKGQKWGKRNYQNLDGTLTPAGRARYSKSGNSSWSGYGGSDDDEDKDHELSPYEKDRQRLKEGLDIDVGNYKPVTGVSLSSGGGKDDDEEDMSDDNWFENKKKEMEDKAKKTAEQMRNNYENFKKETDESFKTKSRMMRVRYNEETARRREQAVKNQLAAAKKFTEESNRKMREQVANIEKTIDESVKTYGPIKSALKQPLQLFTTVTPAVTSAVDSGHYAKTAQKAKAKFRKETGVDHQYGRTNVKRR